jgi:hypothetical protein
MKVDQKYLFTLKLECDSTPVGSFPEGRRIDVRYRGSVTTDAGEYFKSWKTALVPFNLPADGSATTVEWGGLEAEVIAGADSVLVRNDSVAAFAGRLTLRATDGYLINIQLTGAVELSTLFGQKSPTLQNFFKKVPRVPSSTLPDNDANAVLGISFEGATEVQDFAADLKQKSYFRYQHLLRGAFVASGKVTFKDAGIEKAELDVVSLVAT